MIHFIIRHAVDTFYYIIRHAVDTFYYIIRHAVIIYCIGLILPFVIERTMYVQYCFVFSVHMKCQLIFPVITHCQRMINVGMVQVYLDYKPTELW